jgi:nitrite reductase/ring-hydroxylating ferredoxin subunit
LIAGPVDEVAEHFRTFEELGYTDILMRHLSNDESKVLGSIAYEKCGRSRMLLRNAWYIGAWADELRDKPLARRICGDPVVLFRDSSGKAAALADRCCHRAAPLHLGSLVEAGIQCGYHGLVFDATGRCVTIPGQKLIPQDAQVRSYPTIEKDHLVWLWMGDLMLADPTKIVDFPYHNDPAHWPNKHAVYPIKGNYMLMVDNLMDLTHLGYLHARTVGGNPSARRSRHENAADPDRPQVHAVVAELAAATELREGRRLSGSRRPLPGIRIRRAEHDLAMDWRDRRGHRSRQSATRLSLPVSAIPWSDTGDRDQLFLFLVGGKWLPAERSRSNGAALSRDRTDVP